MPLPHSMVAGKKPIVAGGLAPASAAAAPAGGAAAVAPGADSVTFPIQTQLEDNWCWAAVATSVSHFYDTSSSWTQCSLANRILTLPSGEDCCANPGSAACDIPWYLDKALGATSNLLDVRGGAVGFSDLTGLIASKAPLGARVGWSGGGGHFVVLRGWIKTTAGDEFVEVADPYHGDSTVPYGDFTSRYRSTGSWTHSYWTKS